jgi:hypothetical protein
MELRADVMTKPAITATREASLSELGGSISTGSKAFQSSTKERIVGIVTGHKALEHEETAGAA